MRLVTQLGLILLRRAIRSSKMVVAVLILLYMSLFSLDSDRGFAALKSVRAEVASAQENLNKIKAEREMQERKVVAMRPSSLDPDLLEEQARKTLGFTKPDEIIIYGK